MLSARLAILLVASLMSSCFDLGIQLRSEFLDVTTFSAAPAGDVDGDGVSDIILNAQDPLGSKAVPQPGAWVLSGKSLDPIYAIAPDKNGERLTWAIDPRWAVSSLSVRPGDVIVWMIDVSDPESEHVSGVFAIDPSRTVRTPEQRVAPVTSSEPGEAGAEATSNSELEAPVTTEGTYWQSVWLIDPRSPAWSSWNSVAKPEGKTNTGDDALNVASAPFELLTRGIADAHPELHQIAPCGDVDVDGVLDWSGLTESPRSVVLVSGADRRILRTIPMESRPYATIATGCFELDDMDGDGVHDWLVGIHVSQSDDHDAPRTCRLGLIALVSGADFHVINSLERKSFLAGPSGQCPVVVLPQSGQP
jgi:hypothetical protein